MPEAVPKADLLRSLARLVRGLSALFWGLPATLILYVQTAQMDWLDRLGAFTVVPSLIATGLLLFGLMQMAHFQKQERIWQRALDRAQLLAFVNLGLTPFLYWWRKVMMADQAQVFVPFYSAVVVVLVISSLLFLFNLNIVLQRLTAMLPDETLRLETNLFTSFNRSLLLAILVLMVFYFLLSPIRTLPQIVIWLLVEMKRVGLWFALFLLLMPLAMTMALLWKIKEAIFMSVFDERPAA